MFGDLLNLIEKTQLDRKCFPPRVFLDKMKELMPQHLDNVRGAILECNAIIKYLRSQGIDQSARISAFQKIIKKLLKYERDLTEKIRDQFIAHDKQMLEQGREDLKSSEEMLKRIVKQLDQFFRSLHEEELKALEAAIKKLRELYEDLRKIEEDIFECEKEIKQYRAEIADCDAQIQVNTDKYNEQVAGVDQKRKDVVASFAVGIEDELDEFLKSRGVSSSDVSREFRKFFDEYVLEHPREIQANDDWHVDCIEHCLSKLKLDSQMPPEKRQELLNGVREFLGIQLALHARERLEVTGRLLELALQKQQLEEELKKKNAPLGDRVKKLREKLELAERKISSLEQREKELTEEIRQMKGLTEEVADAGYEKTASETPIVPVPDEGIAASLRSADETSRVPTEAATSVEPAEAAKEPAAPSVPGVPASDLSTDFAVRLDVTKEVEELRRMSVAAVEEKKPSKQVDIAEVTSSTERLDL